MSVLKDLNTPIFAAEGVLHLDRANYKLEISGLIHSPLTLSLSELKNNFKNTSINSRLTSVSGWSVRANWNGILWRDFVDYVQPTADARYVLFSSVSDYTTAVMLQDLADSNSMIVWGVDNEDLEDEYGGPVRIIIPHLWGYKSCKWLTKINFIEKYETGYWELRGYSHRGLIEPGETLDVNSQRWRPISGGEVTEF
jgi:DMSO/TMAO reductase YedYZ molybdopterin-dependent catalytic subunit